MNAKKCKYCGKPIVISSQKAQTYTHNKLYCNGVCRTKWTTEHNRQIVRKICLWCHTTFFAPKNQFYCTVQHGENYRNMTNQITKLNSVDYNFIAEIMKLEQLGENYELPTDSIDKETCREWCSEMEEVR